MTTSVIVDGVHAIFDVMCDVRYVVSKSHHECREEASRFGEK